MADFYAVVRKGAGKGEARKLRATGFIPAIVYGGESGNIPVAVKKGTIIKHLRGEVSEAKIWKLDIEGLGEKDVIIKDVQKHPVTDEVLHVDFFEITYGKTMVLLVPLRFEGEAKGVKKGGVLQVLREEVEIECLPRNIVEEIVVDVSNLDLGDTLFIRDIVVPEGIKITDPPDEPVITVVEPEETEAAEQEEESGAEEV